MSAPLGMNPEIRERWVAALRSGKWRQGREALQDARGRLCCLGVLCEIAVEDGVIPAPEESELGTWLYGEDFEHLRPSVRDWAGLSSEDPVAPGNPWALAILNDVGDGDDVPWSFARIADLIEGIGTGATA